MHYLSAEDLGKSYGIKPLFASITFHIEEGDKIAIIARNGSGKSTLLKILSGKESADSGKVWINKEVTVVMLEQEPAFDEEKSILDNILRHNHPVIDAIRYYELVCEEEDVHAIAVAINKMDELDAWNFDSRVKLILSKLNIHQLNQPVKFLSGGQKKRAALAKTLIDIGFETTHVLLIMDEPTNHLDIEMVEWLERFLNQEKITLLLVTHDRYFLNAVCGEIWELDSNELSVYKGDYENYVEKKASRLDQETASIHKARNRYRQELEWMRKQPKARTTKSRSREDNFYLIEQKAKQQTEDLQLELQMKMSRLGGKIAEIKKLNKSYGEKIVLKGFDYTFKKGERMGIVGKNGVGKTTIINLIQGIENPDSGKVNIGETVVFGYFSQQGLVVKEDFRVIEFVKNIAEHFPLAGGGSLSASQFLNLFLFSPEQQYSFISTLSGGEKRRLHLLSILFKNPNFLILDEPTNDLDLPTLGVLENFLLEFEGCVIIVSHDRYFMDRLVDHLLIMEGQGIIRDFPGNYSQYRASEKERREESFFVDIALKNQPVLHTQDKALDPDQKKKLSYKEKRELESLDQEIRQLTQEKESISKKFNEGGLPFEEWHNLSARMQQISLELDHKEMRWLELSELQ
jgi:ATP-binding cassette subfamily F protein uup